MKKNENFLQRSQASDLSLQVLESCAWGFLGATTAVFVAPIAANSLDVHLQGMHLHLATAAVCLVVFFIIDYKQGSLVRHILKEKHISKKNTSGLNSQQKQAHKKYISLMYTMIMLRLTITTTLSIWAAPEIADVITKQSELQHNINAAQMNIQSRDSNIADASTFSRKIEAQAKKEIEQAKKEAEAIIDKAIAQGNRWQKRSYKELQFGWLLNSKNKDPKDKIYAKKIQTAKNQAAALINNAQTSAARKIEKAHFDYLAAQQDTTYFAINSLLLDEGKKSENTRLDKLSRRQNYLYIFDILAALLGLWIAKIRVQRKIAGGDIHLAHRNIFSTTLQVIEQQRLSVLDEIENYFNIDLNRDSHIGSSRTVQVERFKQNGSSRTVQAKNNEVESVQEQITVPFKLPVRDKNGSIVASRKRKCANCNTDISHKRANAKFCGIRCKNAAR